MATFYENAGLCCMPSRRRSVFLWLDYNVLKVSNGHLYHQHLTGNHRRQPHPHRHPDGTHRSCSSSECQHFPRTQTEKKIQTPGPSSASVTQPQSPQASSWPPCQHWFLVYPSHLHAKAPAGSRPCRRADHLVFHMTVDGLPAAKGPQRTVVHCSDFICHAVVSEVREQPDGGTQCPRITSSDCPGHPELCPGDRAKPAVRHPSVPQGPTEFQARTAPSHHHRAHLVRSISHSYSNPNPACGYFLHLVYTGPIPASCGT